MTSSPYFPVVRNLVRRHDLDRYWSTLFAPPPLRVHLLTLYAFNIELARISETTREPHLGAIRLQWWHDSLTNGDNSHPIAAGLTALRAETNLPDTLLHSMIDARFFDVSRQPMPDKAALQAYLQATAGTLFRAALHVCNFTETASEQIAEHAAIAYGLTGLMRAVAFHAAQGQVFIPGDILREQGLNAHNILRGEDCVELRKVFSELCTQAHQELQQVIDIYNTIPKYAVNVFLPLALTKRNLSIISKSSYNPMKDIVTINPLMRFYVMWKAFRKTRI